MLRPVLASTLPFLVASCGQAPSPPPPPQPFVVAITSSVPSAAPIASASAAPPPEPTPPPEPPANTTSRHKVALTLEPGKPPCTLVLDGRSFEDHTEWFAITSVSRMAMEESEGCAASVFYDLAKETKGPFEDVAPAPLEAGVFRKLGQTLPADTAVGPPWNVIEDLDFDDVADLCVVVMTGAYNYSQQCWLFDKKSRTFVRHAELDELIFVQVDRQKKLLTSSFRAGGPVYRTNQYQWQKGKLVMVYQSISYFGEKPDLTPLPPGAQFWLIRYERRNGKMVKTFEGALRDK